MTAAPVPGKAPAHSRLAVWAVGLAAAGAGLVVLALIGLGGGGGGFMVSLAAFVSAIVAKVRHERWALLWLPLLLFPVLVVSAPFWV